MHAEKWYKCIETMTSEAKMNSLKRVWNFFWPNEAYVASLCRGVNFSGRVKHLRLLNAPTARRWEKILDIIRQNQLQIILYDVIIQDDSIPQDIKRKLIGDYLTVTHQIREQEREFLHILRRMNTGEVRHVVMKTFPVAKQLFQAPIKASCDLDILVPIADFQKAATVLLESGYQRFIDHATPDATTHPTGDFYLPLGEEIFKKGPFTVELHTTLVDTIAFPSRILNEGLNRQLTQELYLRTSARSYKRVYVRTFDPSSLFLSLFMHTLYQHNYQSLLRYYEAARLLWVSGGAIDWTYVQDVIKRYRWSSYFFWYLCLLNDFFPEVLPNKIRALTRKHMQSLRPMQLVLYAILKRQAFHPKDGEFNDSQKRLCWAIIDNNFFSSLLGKATQWLRKAVRLKSDVTISR